MLFFFVSHIFELGRDLKDQVYLSPKNLNLLFTVLRQSLVSILILGNSSLNAIVFLESGL